jgi:hypothetical protein
MLSRIALLGAGASLLLGLACSAKSTGHPAATDTNSEAKNPTGNVVGGGGGTSGGTTDGGRVLDGGTCSNLSLTNAPIVGQQQVAEASPVPLGGTIPDGTYILSKDTIYTGPGGTTGATGLTLQEVQGFSGTTIEVLSQPSAPSPLVDTRGTYDLTSVTSDSGTASGFRVTFSFTCPTSSATSRGYSVVNGQLLEFVSSNEVLTYTAQ